MKYWHQLAEDLKDESHSLHIAFTKHKPSIDENNNIEVSLDNSVQESEINNKKTKILGYLKEKLSNKSITLSVKILNNDQLKQKAYLPEEKFKLLSNKNPNIKTLKDQLDLDFY